MPTRASERERVTTTTPAPVPVRAPAHPGVWSDAIVAMGAFALWVLLALAIMSLWGCTPSRDAAGPMADRVRDLEEQTIAMVHFRAHDDELVAPGERRSDMRAYCGGVWLSQHVILTAAHCTDEENGGLYVVTRDDWHQDGWIVVHAAHEGYRDEKRDLTTLRVFADFDHPWAVVREAAMHPGADVLLMGHPIGLAWTFSRAYVSQRRPRIMNAIEVPENALQIQGPVWFGYSGSGAFDLSGELIGIGSWIRQDAPDIGFYVDTSEIRSFLRHVTLD